MSVGDTRYAFTYDHDARVIEVRRGNLQGTAVESFSNQTALTNVKSFFDSLGQGSDPT
jgi:hypothetical protein